MVIRPSSISSQGLFRPDLKSTHSPWMTDIRVIEKSDDREKDLRQKLANGSTSSIKTIFNSEMHETAHAYDASCP